MPDKIIHPELIKQVVSFEGMRLDEFRGICPTDIDAYIDFGGKGALFFEVKLKGSVINKGQRIALEKLVDSSKIHSILIYCEHNCTDGSNVILNDCICIKYYYNGEWRYINGLLNVGYCVSEFAKWLRGVTGGF